MTNKGLSEQVGACIVCTRFQWKTQMTVTERGLICEACKLKEREGEESIEEEADNRGGIGKAPLL